MVFVFSYWDRFCASLDASGLHSIPACEVTGEMERYLVLKHDIEGSVEKAFKMAQIEHRHGHRGSYYAHAFLLDKPENVSLLQQMQAMGHEISYHHDVMDSNHGELAGAMAEFEKNRARFEALGFPIRTVCQHGNPVVERVGYTSNRDFFRSEQVQRRYPQISDIMVDFPQKHATDYGYYSDAGRRFQRIYDPLNNDVINSDDQNIPFEDLETLKAAMDARAILSTHPHRWTNRAAVYRLRSGAFKVIKAGAKLLMKVPLLKKLMGRYYYIAKKI